MATQPLDIITRLINETGPGVRGVQQNLGKLDRLTGTLNKGFGGLQKTIGAGLAGAAAVGVGGMAALVFEMRDSVSLARTQRDVVRQLNAVLESTGGVAGLTSQEIQDMASSLQSVTNFGDESIIRGQNLLLTFKEIGRDTFPRATETMLDMATAMDQDLKQTAIQLGKALNDPIMGVTALRRVGVQLTSSQEEMIQQMVEAGDVAAAQGVILDELESQFGGSARSQADALIQLGNLWGDFKEIVGSVVLAVLTPLADSIIPRLTNVISALGPHVETVQEAFGKLAEGDVSGWWQQLRGAVVNVLNELGIAPDRVRPFFNILEDTVGVIRTLINYFSFTVREGDAFNDFLTDLPAGMQPFVKLLGSVIGFLSETIPQFVEWKDVLGVVGVVIGVTVVQALLALLSAAAPIVAVFVGLIAIVRGVRTAWENNFLGIQEIAETVWGGIMEIVNGLSLLFSGNLEEARSTLESGMGEILSGLRELLGNLWSDVLEEPLTTLWENASGWFEDQDWAAHGQAIKDGIVNGLTGLWEDANESITDADWASIGQTVTEAISSGMGSVGIAGMFGGTENIEGTIGPAIDAVAGRIQEFVETVRTLWNEHGQTIIAVMLTAWTVIQALIGAAIDTIVPAVQEFVANVGLGLQQFTPVIENLKALWQSLQPVIAAVLAVIGALVIAAVATLSASFTAISRAIEPALGAFSSLLSIVINVMTLIVTSITNAIRAIVALVTGDTQALLQIWTEHNMAVQEIVANLVAGITGFISGLVQTVLALVSGLVDGFIQFFTNLYQRLVGGSIVPDMVNGIIEWIGTMRDRAVEFVGDLWDQVVSLFESAKTTLSETAQGIIDTVIETLSGAYDSFVNIGDTLIESLITGINNAKARLRNMLSGVAKVIPGWLKSFLGIASPAPEFVEIGATLGDSVGMGIVKAIPAALIAVESLGGQITSGLAKSLQDTTGIQRAAAGLLDAASPDAGVSVPLSLDRGGSPGAFGTPVSDRGLAGQPSRRRGRGDGPTFIFHIDARGAAAGVEERIRDMIEEAMDERAALIEARLRTA